MRVLLPILLAAASLGAAGAVAAQPPASSGAASPAREGRRADWAARREAQETREVADLSTVLRLRPGQQAGLRVWLEARRPAGAWRGRGEDRPDMAATAPPTTAQTLDREASRMAERETRARARLDATRRFYAGLSLEQQGVFDALERLRHGHGEARGWGRRGGEGGMRMGWRGRGDAGGPDAPPPRVGA